MPTMSKRLSVTDKDSMLKELVNDPRWEWVEGLLVYPYYNRQQKVRLKHFDSMWLPDMTDQTTASHVLCLYIKHGGVVSYSKDTYTTSHAKSKDMGLVALKSLYSLWFEA